jgi:hypothetical protein
VTDVRTEPVPGSATTSIAAPISDVYAAVIDVTQMGEWSPECVESFSHPPYVGWQKWVYGRLANRQKAMTKGMQATLDRIRQSLER